MRFLRTWSSCTRTVWEVSQKTILKMAADRGPFICQSQSLNVHIAEPNYGKLTSMHFYAWKLVGKVTSSAKLEYSMETQNNKLLQLLPSCVFLPEAWPAVVGFLAGAVPAQSTVVWQGTAQSGSLQSVIWACERAEVRYCKWKPLPEHSVHELHPRCSEVLLMDLLFYIRPNS